MTINNNAEPFWFCNWNEYNLNLLTSNNWRASLVPAAAVIPAPIAYIKVVAVKKLVVGLLGCDCGPPNGVHCGCDSSSRSLGVHLVVCFWNMGPLL